MLILRLLPQSRSWRGIVKWMPYYVGSRAQRAEWLICLPRWQVLAHGDFEIARAALAPFFLTEHDQVCLLARLPTHSVFALFYICSFICSFACSCIGLCIVHPSVHAFACHSLPLQLLVWSCPAHERTECARPAPVGALRPNHGDDTK